METERGTIRWYLYRNIESRHVQACSLSTHVYGVELLPHAEDHRREASASPSPISPAPSEVADRVGHVDSFFSRRLAGKRKGWVAASYSLS